MRISDWSSDVCSSDLLVVQLTSCDPKMLFFPPEIAAMAIEAAEQRKVQPIDWSEFATRAAPVAALPEQKTDETCYLQYSSGSTRFPHGVAVTHGALLNNLSAHSHGMELQDSDRCISWLPWYHDMRSEESRVGKEGVSTCRYRWSPVH